MGTDFGDVPIAILPHEFRSWCKFIMCFGLEKAASGPACRVSFSGVSYLAAVASF